MRPCSNLGASLPCFQTSRSSFKLKMIKPYTYGNISLQRSNVNTPNHRLSIQFATRKPTFVSASSPSSCPHRDTAAKQTPHFSPLPVLRNNGAARVCIPGMRMQDANATCECNMRILATTRSPPLTLRVDDGDKQILLRSPFGFRSP